MPANRMWLYNTGWHTIQNPPGSNAASTLAPGVNHTLLEYISAKTAVGELDHHAQYAMEPR